MRDLWAQQFRHFALSVDTVDDGNFRLIQQSLERYLCKTLGVTFFRLLVDGFQVPMGRKMVACLHTVWVGPSNVQWADFQPDPPILDEDGKSFSQTTYAYSHRRPLWLVAGGRGARELAKAKKIVDLWSGSRRAKSTDLPEYRGCGRGDSKTSIILPLELDYRLFGVMCLQFDERLLPTWEAEATLGMLARSLARIIWLHETHTSQRKGTARAFEAMGELDEGSLSPLDPRSVFLASSSQASDDVMVVLREVLSKYEGEKLFELHDWAAQAASGSINDQIRNDIRSCQFGVCYLSEEARFKTADGYRFLDNSNVLFEAGMMQMLGETLEPDSKGTSRWIPVREDPRLTPAAPFDFAGDRILIVPRDDAGELLVDELRERFTVAVEAQIEALRLR